MKNSLNSLLAWALALIAFAFSSSSSFASSLQSQQKGAILEITLDPSSPPQSAFVAVNTFRTLSVVRISNTGDAVGFIRDIYFTTYGVDTMVPIVDGSSYPTEDMGGDYKGVFISHVGLTLKPGQSIKVVSRCLPARGTKSVFSDVWFLTGDFSSDSRVGDWAPGHDIVQAFQEGMIKNASVRIKIVPGQVVTLGFAVSCGEYDSKGILIRAVGPGLKQFGLSDTLADPSIKLFGQYGPIAANDNWEAGYAWTADASGAFPLQKGSADSLLAIMLPNGTYTVQLTGTVANQGDVLLEVYQLPN